MRCLSCNKILTEEEDSMVYDSTDERIQLCFDCLEGTDIYGEEYDD